MGDKESNATSTEEYQGQPGQTRKGVVHYSCSECDLLYGAEYHVSINVQTDPDLGELLSKGELNTVTCPSCSTVSVPNLTLTYHDPKARSFALLLPEGLRHEELTARARLLDALAADQATVPEYVRRAEVVFGTSGLLRLLDRTMQALSPEASVDEQAEARKAMEQKQAELALHEEELMAREEDVHSKQEDLVLKQSKLEHAQKDIEKGWADLDRERAAVRALSLKLQAQDRSSRGAPAAKKPQAPPPAPPPIPEPGDKALALEGRPQKEVDRWRASEESGVALRHDEQLFFLHRADADRLAGLTAAEPDLMIQLHDLEPSPLIAILVLPADIDLNKATGDEAISWTLDPNDDEHGKILEQLSEECLLNLDLYDGESRPVATWEVRAPLTENVRLLLERVEKIMEGRADPDFAAAIEAFDKMGVERLGKKQHNFTADSFQELATPASARLALGIITYWSEEENAAYLFNIKSFPMTYWRAIRERVVSKALEFGLCLSAPLMDFALRQKLEPTRKELLSALVSSFAEVSLRIKPSDLDPQQELENWKRLMAECVKEGVEVDHKIEKLAAAAAKRAGVVMDESAPGGDLALLSDDELLALLSDRTQSRDVALELCERGDTKLIDEIYGAVCNMTRAEVARVIPAMLQLGAEVVPFLIKGLKHRKSFIRQGCALALGTKRAGSSIEPLMEMLLGEPTNVWKEASRGLGDMGTLSLGALVAGVRSADAEGRERIAWSLAQTAMDESCLSEVQAMSKGRDTRLARVATRALEVLEQVQQCDQEVRGQRPLSSHTIVRTFTRQFFDSLAAEVSELGEDDILEQEEVLDDNDILDEEVEISDEDILNQ